MTEVETGRKSLECAVLWLSQWKRKADCLSHTGLKRGGGQLRVLQSSKGAVECISDSDPSRRPCSWPCIGDDPDSEGQLSYFAHHFINRRTEARLAKDFAFKTTWTKSLHMLLLRCQSMFAKCRMPLGAGMLPGEGGTRQQAFYAQILKLGGKWS